MNKIIIASLMGILVIAMFATALAVKPEGVGNPDKCANGACVKGNQLRMADHEDDEDETENGMNQGTLISAAVRERARQFKITKEQLKNMGYHGSVSDFATSFNQEVNEFKWQIRNRLENGTNFTAAVVKNMVARRLSDIREDLMGNMTFNEAHFRNWTRNHTCNHNFTGNCTCNATRNCTWNPETPVNCAGTPSAGACSAYNQTQCTGIGSCTWTPAYCSGTPAEDICSNYAQDQCLNITGCAWNGTCTGKPDNCTIVGGFDPTGNTCENQTRGCYWTEAACSGDVDNCTQLTGWGNGVCNQTSGCAWNFEVPGYWDCGDYNATGNQTCNHRPDACACDHDCEAMENAGCGAEEAISAEMRFMNQGFKKKLGLVMQYGTEEEQDELADRMRQFSETRGKLVKALNLDVKAIRQRLQNNEHVDMTQE